MNKKNELLQQIEILKLRFVNNHNCDDSIVDDIMALNRLSLLNELSNNEIRYKYTDDEYGREAKKIHGFSPIKRAYDGDAGIDLPVILKEEHRKVGAMEVWPNEREMLHTGICMEFPIGYYGRIIHRSSTEKNHRLRVIEGVIDDYRGELLVQVHNTNSCKVSVYHGDRLSQLIIARTYPFVVNEAEELRPSVRGSKGFGSSGK